MLQWVIEATAERLAEAFCDRLQTRLTPGYALQVALTGGESAKPFYRALSRRFRPESGPGWDVNGIDFYWSDERLVPPESADSNYRLAHDTLLEPAHIPAQRIHRMPAEAEPEHCARTYAAELTLALAKRSDGTPQFPLILLGLGKDGHTASLFPGTDILYENDKLVRVAVHTTDHPHDRLTFTPRLINAAREAWFLITGRAKAEAVAKLYQRSSPPIEVPALIVDPALTDITYFVDADAATEIKRK